LTRPAGRTWQGVGSAVVSEAGAPCQGADLG